MIPYADLERAITRWKARQAGHEVSAPAPEHEVGADAYAESHEIADSGMISIEETPKP